MTALRPRMQIVGFADLAELYGIKFSNVHIWRLVRAGKFPRPFKLTPNGRNYWLAQTIEKFIECGATSGQQTCGNMPLNEVMPCNPEEQNVMVPQVIK